MGKQGPWSKWEHTGWKINWAETWKAAPHQSSQCVMSCRSNLFTWGLVDSPACQLCQKRRLLKLILLGRRVVPLSPWPSSADSSRHHLHCRVFQQSATSSKLHHSFYASRRWTSVHSKGFIALTWYSKTTEVSALYCSYHNQARHGLDVHDNQTSDFAGVNSPLGRSDGGGTREKEGQICRAGSQVWGMEGKASVSPLKWAAEALQNSLYIESWDSGSVDCKDEEPIETSLKLLKKFHVDSG